MVEERPMALNMRAGLAGPRPPAAATLTPREVLAILRRHVLLIIVLTVLGFVVGGATWFLLRRFLPRYTARTYIEVLPPVVTDPMEITTLTVHRERLYGHRLSLANIIKQQMVLGRLRQ